MSMGGHLRPMTAKYSEHAVTSCRQDQHPLTSTRHESFPELWWTVNYFPSASQSETSMMSFSIIWQAES